MIEQQNIDLNSMKERENNLVHLSSPQHLPWSGIQSLAPFESIALAVDVRDDVYILDGSLIENAHENRAGSFLRRSALCIFEAGATGALLFINRDMLDGECKPETLAEHDLVWFPGHLPGMSVAHLAQSPHQLSLVLWQPGTRVHAHTHTFGEEILVLKGELCDEKGTYPAGCWLRFLPDSGHAPFAEQETLILLRNGHLRDSKAPPLHYV